MKAIRVAVVDDSVFIRKAMERVLEGIPGIRLTGSANSGEELLRQLEEWDPHLIILDLMMPGIGGLQTLDKILAWKKIPVLILSQSRRDAPETLEALSRGAVDFIEKRNYSLVDFAALRTALREKIMEVISSTGKRRAPTGSKPRLSATHVGKFDAVLIGASTGGPPAIERILRDLGDDVGAPVAIVQHMPPGFTRALANRLNDNLPLTIKEAVHGEPFVTGAIYIAPAGLHMKFHEEEGQVLVALTRQPVDASHRPSIDVMFDSAVPVYGRRALAVLLTGMGRDGAQGLANLLQKGAHTIAENEETSVVYGMPRVAMDLHAVRESLPLYQIGSRIRGLLR